MSNQVTIDPALDFAIERFIDAPPRLVWEALRTRRNRREMLRSGTLRAPAQQRGGQ